MSQFQVHLLCYMAHLQFHVRVGIAAATVLSKPLEKTIEELGIVQRILSISRGKKVPVITKSLMEQVVCIFRTKYLQSVVSEEGAETTMKATDVAGYLARLKRIINTGRFGTDLDLALVGSWV